MVGPYKIKGNKISYVGNKLFKPLNEVRGIRPPDLSNRHILLKTDDRFSNLIKIYGKLHTYITDFMKAEGALLFDLPITTRMISSPGSLTGTIISDVEPFKINFFEHETFLTQSSQLYLEFAINAKGINKVFCWDKSFRRERADFRHLPEFTHVEFEGNIDFEQNLNLQERFLKYIISKLLTNNKKELLKFLSEDQIKGLKYISELPKFKRITFHNAFKLLYEKTKNEKYLKPSITKFGAYEEILLTEIIGDEPIFIINYISDEVAFYHANKVGNPSLAVNADLLFPGYGEIIGSGERVHTKKDTEKKAKHFELDMDDYKAYIDSRDSKNPIIHSGWGMGVDRFIQCMLHLPFVWEAKVFPRVDNSNRP